MNKFKGQVKVAGRTYDCEVIDGVRYINGMTSEEFVNQLPPEEIVKLAMVGAVAVDCESAGIPVSPVRVYKNFDNKPN